MKGRRKTPIVTLEPIQLAAPDGRVFAFACPYCLQVPTIGEYLVRTEPTAELLEESRSAAARCCLCHTCGKVEVKCFECKRCRAQRLESERPAREAREREDEDEAASFARIVLDGLKTWAGGEWPLTVVHARDGVGFLAFPLELNEVPPEVMERVEAMIWMDANQEAAFGRGRTPEAALADLRERAKIEKASST